MSKILTVDFIRNSILVLLLVFVSKMASSQVESRIGLTSFSSSINTGQNYNPWLNDDLNDLVTNVWTPINQQYVDVTLPLERRSSISKVSLYDYEGTFTTQPVFVYAQDGTQRTLLGIFTGEAYLSWVDIIPATPVLADAIVIHKYANNIPQKIKVFGFPDQVNPIQSIINFPLLVTKTLGDAPFNLVATSNNTETPVTFTSSNSSIVSVSNASGTWKGTVLTAGIANITASQTASNNYTTAANVTRTQTVQPGNYQVLPGRIEAESYDTMNGVQTETTGDAGGGQNVGYVDDSDWMDYQVNVTASGTYTLKLRLASITNTGIIELRTTGGNVLSTVNTPNTGAWQTYITVNTTINLSAGQQTLRIYAEKAGWNLNWFEVAAISQVQAVINFPSLVNRKLGDLPFTLNATSSNTQTPITYSSSNPAVISVSNATGAWKATPVATGTASITASQVSSADFLAANATQQQTVLAAGSTTISGKILIDGKRWYQLNNTSGTLEKLFDGNTSEAPTPGWGLVLSNFDAYYPLLAGEEMTIDSIKMFDGQGGNANEPMTLSIITDTWQRIPIATFTGSQYMAWVGPYPDRATGPNTFKLDAPVTNARYLVINTNWAYPTELQLYGSYTAGATPTPISNKAVKLKNAFGINAFEWDFEAPNNPVVIDEQRMNAVKNFTGVRHYMDWEKLELAQGSYTYNPTHSGGWNYDTIYQRCKAEGIEVLACLKTLPGWMQNTYPADVRDAENVPVKYGNDFTNPNSYIEQAQVAFQYAARYGSNTNVNGALLSVNSQPRWTNDQVNVVKVGMGLIKYIECDNERDKWWKGRKAYQTGREYAANLSAFYDGHKNTMGPGVGVKNADSSMKVVMGGTALASTDYVRGMIDWCKQFRGYKGDGTIDLCWDIINYHLYSNDAQSSQAGNPTRGAAPEVSGTDKVAQDFVKAAHVYAYDMPVWVTECGYDVNQGSPLKAIAIKNKSILQTQADWILRTALLYVRAGVEKVFFYQLYDENINSSTQFASMGFMNANRTRKPAADFLYQTNKLFGQYNYKKTINSYPIVDQYEINGTSMYMLVMPTEKDTSKNYLLDLGMADSAYLYIPQPGSNDMLKLKVKLNNGKQTINVKETPIFIVPVIGNSISNQNEQFNADTLVELREVTSAGTGVANTSFLNKTVTNLADSSFKLFPNPASSFVKIEYKSIVLGKVQIRIIESGSGKVVKNYVFEKMSDQFSVSLDVNELKGGFYSIDIKQNTMHMVKKMIKTFE